MSIPYCYIDSKNKEIRLLRLLPAPREDSPLQVRIIHASLGTANYQALSYVWGDQADKRTLEVTYDGSISTGKEVRDFTTATIGANLDSALRSFRKQECEITLWVDAICINQSNNVEKSLQVRLMALIYREAAEVLIWLGPTNEFSNAAMDTFYNIGKEVGKLLVADTGSGYDGETGLLDELSLAETWEGEDAVNQRGQKMQSFLDMISGKDSSTGVGVFQPVGVEDLLTRSWWSRVWVLQEFLMAKRATFICGHKRISESYFIRAVVTFFGYSRFLSGQDSSRDPNATVYEKTFVIPRPGNQALYLLNTRHSFDKDVPTLMSLMGTLYANKKDPVDATDPRDRVFALLGVAKDDMGLQPNYDLSCAEVFTQATSRILQTGQIEVLSLCRPHLNNFRLPSWVVDWTSEVGHCLDPFDRMISGLGSSVYDQADGVENARAFIQPGPEPVLSLRGTLMDQIQLTSQSWQEYRTTIYQSLDNLTVTLKSQAPSEPSLCRDIAEIILRHVVCRGWINMFRDLTDNLHLGESMDVDEIVWDILSGGDTAGNGVRTGTRPDNLLEAMRLLAASEDYKEWLLDIRSRGHFLYIVQMIEEKAHGYRAIACANGRLGYAPEPTRETDLIVMFAGAQTPFIVRPTGNRRHELLGPAYIQGMMKGECREEVDHRTTFDLI